MPRHDRATPTVNKSRRAFVAKQRTLADKRRKTSSPHPVAKRTGLKETEYIQ